VSDVEQRTKTCLSVLKIQRKYSVKYSGHIIYTKEVLGEMLRVIPATHALEYKTKTIHIRLLSNFHVHPSDTDDIYISTTINSTHIMGTHITLIQNIPKSWKLKTPQSVPQLAPLYYISLKLDTKGKVMPKLYDKQDDFNFSIINFLYLCTNIPISPAYGI
jgi:hypothetical protein